MAKIMGAMMNKMSGKAVQPSTLNPQPSTLNPQPSTLNPQPSTLNPQPSTPSGRRREHEQAGRGRQVKWEGGCGRQHEQAGRKVQCGRRSTACDLQRRGRECHRS